MSQADDAITFARAQIGKPYKFGAVGPDSYDCSGLIVAAYRHANPPITLPHWTGALINIGREVARGELQPGDLVFPDSGHVQLYVGNNQMIEAPRPGEVVRQGPLWGFWRARRITGNPGSVSNIASSALGVLSELPGPWSAGASVVDVLRPIGAVTTNLLNPHFWARIGSGLIGAGLVVAGLLYLNRGKIHAVGSAVGSVASTVVQGAAFGAGAGATGGVSAGGSRKAVSAVPARIPRAPAPANRAAITPSTAVPVTAPLPEFDRPSTLNAQQSPGGTYSVYTGRAPRPTSKLPGDAKGAAFLGGPKKRSKK
jgi:hypothetical protein